MAMKRQTAYKVRIGNLASNELVKALGEWEPNYVEVGEWKVSRVNVIATVVDKFEGEDGSYGTLTVDDGSGSIRVRVWQDETKLFEDVVVGDVVLLICRVKDYVGEIYLSPEIVKKLDNSWLKLRVKELEYLIGKSEKKSGKKIDMRGKVLDFIREKDNGSGVDVSLIFDSVGYCEEVINDMVENGELFYIRSGFVKEMG